MRRRNSDTDLRALERKAAQTHATADMAALLSARVRAGLVDPWLARVAAAIGHEAARLAVEPLGATELHVSDRASDQTGQRWHVEGYGADRRISGLGLGDSERRCAACGNAYDAHSTNDVSAPPPAWVTTYGENCPGRDDDSQFWIESSDEQADAFGRADLLKDARAGDRVAVLVLADLLRNKAPEAALILLGDRSGRDADDAGLVGGSLSDLFGHDPTPLTIEDYRDLGVPESLPWFWRVARPILHELATKVMLDVADEFLGLPSARRVVPGSQEWNTIREKFVLMRKRPRVAWFLSVPKKVRSYVGLLSLDEAPGASWAIDLSAATDDKFELPSNKDGGYPILYYYATGDAMCGRCASRMDEPWELIGAEAFMEDPPVFCSGCSRSVESAYGPDAEGVEDNPPRRRSARHNPLADSDDLAQRLYDAGYGALEMPRSEVNLSTADRGHPVVDEPERYRWFLIPKFPVRLFGLRLHDLLKDAGQYTSQEEWRHDKIVDLLRREPAWPAVVTADGILVDGFHRVTANRTLRRQTMPVVVAVERSGSDFWDEMWLGDDGRSP